MSITKWWRNVFQQPKRQPIRWRILPGARPRRASLRLEYLEDRLAPATINVLNLDDAGADSFRAAITQANTDAGDDTIVFAHNLAGGTINLGSALPDLSSNIDIQGPAPAISVSAAGNEIQNVKVIDVHATSATIVINADVFGLGADVRVYLGDFAADPAGSILVYDSTTNGDPQTPTNLGAAVVTISYTNTSATATAVQGATLLDSGWNLGPIVTNYPPLASSFVSIVVNEGGLPQITTWAYEATLTPLVSGVTVRRDTGGDYRIFNVTAGNTVAISDLTISNGLSTAGGGILNGGTLTLTNCTVTGNSISGGSLLRGGGISNVGTLTLTNSTVSGNSTSGVFDNQGGGIYNDGTLTLTNSTVSGNSASGLSGSFNHGGGIFFQQGTLNLTNSTLSGNSVSGGIKRGGGVFINGGTMTLNNTIVANSTNGDVFQNSGTITGSHNLIEDGSGGLAGTISGDPNLGSLANNGGTTKTHALLPGSSAIDAGTSGAGIPATDQRGIIRGAAVDIGAFESRGFTVTVDSGNNQRTLKNTAYDNPLVVLVTSAFTEPVEGGQVTFTAPGAGASATFTTANPATIAANGKAQINVSANGTGGDFTVSAAASGANSVSFSLTNQIVTSLSFQQQPTNTPAGQIINQAAGGVKVALLDQDGILVANATDSVDIDASGPPGFFTGTTPKNAVAGVATFDDLKIKKAGDYTLTAELALNSAIFKVSDSFHIGSSHLGFVVTPDPLAAGTVFGSTPASAKSGAAFVVKVVALDDTEAVDTSFTGSITVALESATQQVLNDILGAANNFKGTFTASATAGIATFSGLSLDKWGFYTLNAASTGLTGVVSPTISVTATKLVFQNIPASVRSGDAFQVQFDAQDITNDRALNFTGAVTVSINSAIQPENGNLDIKNTAVLGGTKTVDAALGLATFSTLTLDKWGNYTLAATSSGLTGAVSTSTTVTARNLSIGTVTTVRSGDTFSGQAEAKDITGDRAKNFGGNITVALNSARQVEDGNLDISGTAVFGGTKTLATTQGLASFTDWTLDKWGDYTLKANSAGLLQGVSNTIVVTASKLVFQSIPASVRSGDAFQVQFDAQDITNDRALNFIGAVTVSINSAIQPENGNLDIKNTAVLGGTKTVNAVLGLATFSTLTLDKWGNYTLAATSSGLTGATSTSTTVTARTFSFVTPAFVRSGDTFAGQVTAVDITGDRARNFGGNITVALNSAVQVEDNNLNILGTAVFSGTKTLPASQGLASFTDWKLDKWGNYTLNANSGGVLQGVSDTIIVTARKLVFLSSPAFVRSGDAFTAQFDAQDITNDRAMNFTSAVTVSINSAVQVEKGNLNIAGQAVLGGTKTTNAVLGLASFSTITLDKWGNYTLRAQSPGTPAGPVDSAVSTKTTITAFQMFVVSLQGKVVLAPVSGDLLIKGRPVPFFQPPQLVAQTAFPVKIWAVDITVNTNTLRNQVDNVISTAVNKGKVPDLTQLKLANAALNFNDVASLNLTGTPGGKLVPTAVTTTSLNNQSVGKKASGGEVIMDVRVDSVGEFQFNASSPQSVVPLPNNPVPPARPFQSLGTAVLKFLRSAAGIRRSR